MQIVQLSGLIRFQLFNLKSTSVSVRYGLVQDESLRNKMAAQREKSVTYLLLQFTAITSLEHLDLFHDFLLEVLVGTFDVVRKLLHRGLHGVLLLTYSHFLSLFDVHLLLCVGHV